MSGARNRFENFMKEANAAPRISWAVDAGLMAYDSACQLQRDLVGARKAGVIPDVLLVCEHPHVITLGRNGRREHLRASDQVLRQMHIEFYASDRGGDITYHGPGQIVGYPILDLAQHRRDVRWYVEQLEEVLIRATADFGIEGKRLESAHGVWIDSPCGQEKLAALGVHLSRWVTSHGFAYNVSTDLRYFDLIVPCGIPDKRATSLERLLDRAVSAAEVRSRVAEHFGDVFGLAMVPTSRRDLELRLANLAEPTRTSLAGASEDAAARESVL